MEMRKRIRLIAATIIATILALAIPKASLAAGASVMSSKLASHRIAIDQGLPNNSVNAIAEDNFGLIWIGTRNGLCYYDGYNVTIYINKVKDDTVSLSPTIASLESDKEKCLMKVEMPGKPVAVIDTKTGRIIRQEQHVRGVKVEKPEYVEHDAVQQVLTPTYVCWLNKAGDLWVVNRKDKSIEKAKRLHLLDDVAYTVNRKRKCFIIEKNDILYIATYGNGLFLYDTKTQQIRHFSSQDQEPLFDTNFLTCIHLSKNGCIWAGTETAGAVCIYKPLATVEYIKPRTNALDMRDNSIGCILKAPSGKLVAADFIGSLYTVDINTRQFTTFSKQPSSIRCVMFDREGNRWTATRGGGIYINGTQHTRGDKKHPLPTNDIKYLVQASDGTVWAATPFKGLMQCRYNKQADTIAVRCFLDKKTAQWISHLYIDNRQTLWISTNNGLYALPYDTNPQSDNDFIRYGTDNGSLKSDIINCVEQVADDTLMAAVNGHGIAILAYDDKGKVNATRYIGKGQGLADNTVATILKSGHNVAVGTDNGLSIINLRSLDITTLKSNGSKLGDYYINYSGYAESDGTMLLGCYDGIAKINIDNDNDTDNKHPCVITELKIDGNNLYSYSDIGGADSVMMLTHKLKLAHSQNNIEIYFSGLNFKHNAISMFEYYLEGLEEGWREHTSNNVAIYQNLNPGKYIFHVRRMGSNNDTTLEILIKEPWYNSLTAWLLYILAAAAIGTVIYRQWKRNFKLKHQMAVEKELTAFRLNFFTQVSHEFRTPLAIIQNSLRQIKENKNEPPKKTVVQTAWRGSQRLLKLINQLIEFRKIQTEKTKLNLITGDIVKKTRAITDDFFGMADFKDINLFFTPTQKELKAVFSPDAYDTIVSNLISNAIKYTPQKGTVAVKMHTVNDDQIKLTVEDSGPGISDTQLAHIFKPFMHGYVSAGGMGIGLYMAKRMAELHHGTLEYSRSEEYGGSRFTLLLPLNDDSYAPEDYAQVTAIADDDDDDNSSDDFPEEPVKAATPNALNDIHVAIIEDDIDMMEQLKAQVGTYFKIDAYMTGQAGYDGITANPPALLLCDVMLPDIDGYAIVKKLKKEPKTQMLPVVMLTALNDEEHQIKGYEAGADDYMVKPCNFKLLLARITQLIKWNAEKITPESDNTPATIEDNTDTTENPAESGSQDNVKSSASTDETGNSQPLVVFTSALDKAFKERVEIITAQNLGDSNFSPDILAEKLHVGRTKLLGKMKEIFGEPPAKYILNRRLEAAEQMLLIGEYSINEISDKTGFNDPGYFNKCFKAKYGITPGKYGKQAK